MASSVAASPWHLAGLPSLSVTAQPGLLEVTVPRSLVLDGAPSLGLFMTNLLSPRFAFETDELFCTSAAVVWHCVNASSSEATSSSSDVVVSLPEPPWRAKYVVMLMGDRCLPRASSVDFAAGPPPLAPTAPRVEVIRSDGASSDKPICVEASVLHCSNMTVYVTGRGGVMDYRDAVILLPISVASMLWPSSHTSSQRRICEASWAT